MEIFVHFLNFPRFDKFLRKLYPFFSYFAQFLLLFQIFGICGFFPNCFQISLKYLNLVKFPIFYRLIVNFSIFLPISLIFSKILPLKKWILFYCFWGQLLPFFFSKSCGLLKKYKKTEFISKNDSTPSLLINDSWKMHVSLPSDVWRSPKRSVIFSPR